MCIKHRKKHLSGVDSRLFSLIVLTNPHLCLLLKITVSAQLPLRVQTSDQAIGIN